MKTKFIKNLVSVIALAMITLPLLSASVAPANASSVDLWGGKQDDVQSGLGVGNRDPRDIVTSVINILMGFLGIIAVAMILVGGFKWMTAQGNESQIKEAQNIIKNGAIGLVIILAAFAIATFIINSALKVTS